TWSTCWRSTSRRASRATSCGVSTSASNSTAIAVAATRKVRRRKLSSERKTTSGQEFDGEGERHPALERILEFEGLGRIEGRQAETLAGRGFTEHLCLEHLPGFVDHHVNDHESIERRRAGRGGVMLLRRVAAEQPETLQSRALHALRARIVDAPVRRLTCRGVRTASRQRGRPEEHTA